MKIWTCRREVLREVSPEMPERGSKTSPVPVVGATFGIFSARSKWFHVGRDWWPWTKPDCFSVTRRQSNKQWSGGIAAHPAPKNSECKSPLEKISSRFFWDQDGILLIYYLPKSQTINAEYFSSLLVQLTDILKEKRRGRFTKGFCSCMTMPRLKGCLQPRRNWTTWAFSILITHPILRICPRRTTICSLEWKNNWKVAIFRPTRRSLLPRWPGWTDKLLIFFWVACKS